MLFNIKRYSTAEADAKLPGTQWNMGDYWSHCHGKEKESSLLLGSQVTKEKAGKTS